MSLKSLFTLALATGFAAAKPIDARAPEELPVYRRETSAAAKRGFGNGFDNNQFNFFDNFNNVNQQQQVIQIQEENFQISNNGFQQQVVEQVNQVLVVNNDVNGFNNGFNDLIRRSNFNNQFQDVSTVMLVVQEIQIAVDDGFGNQFEQNVFAQSALVANRGQFATQTVMVFSQETLIAQNILNQGNGFGNGFNGIGGVGNGINNSLPTPTAAVQLFGEKPTWSSIAEDPAATVAGFWQNALSEAQNVDNINADNQVNKDAAAQEKNNLAAPEANANNDQAKAQSSD